MFLFFLIYNEENSDDQIGGGNPTLRNSYFYWIFEGVVYERVTVFELCYPWGGLKPLNRNERNVVFSFIQEGIKLIARAA